MEKTILIPADWKIRSVAVSIFLPLIFLVWDVTVINAQFLEAGVQKFKVPVEAPDLTIKGLNGEKISFKELRGKIVILNFFGTR